MRRATQAFSIAVTCCLGWILAAGCSDDRNEQAQRVDGPSSGASLEPSAAARERVAELQQGFRIRDSLPVVKGPALRSSPASKPPAHERAAIPKGTAGFARAQNGRIQVSFQTPSADPNLKLARTELPQVADGSVLVEDQGSSVAVGVELEGARQVPIAVSEGIAIYRGGLGEGTDVVHRPVETGNEDYVVFASRPKSERLGYRIDVSRVKGLRFVSGVLELVDADGTPRLRMAPPGVVDAKGNRAPATVTIEGCAYDTNPAGPWGRPIVAPGATSCRVVLAWNGDGLEYPLVVDPPWTTTGSMTYSRYYHKLVTLTNGKALVTGGYGCGPTGCDYQKTTELYDPTSGTWSMTGNMVTGRYLHASAALTNGNAMVAGGYYYNSVNWYLSYLDSAEVYSTSTGTWSATPVMAVGRYYPTLTALTNGKALVAGGYGCPAGSCSYQASAQTYDPSTNTWSSAGSLSTNRYGHRAARLSDGTVLITGGWGPPGYVGAAERYSPTTNSWSAAGSNIDPRSEHIMEAFGTGKALVSTGYGNSGDLATAEVYSTSTNSWTSVSSAVYVREYAASGVLANGKVLVTGGYGCGPSGCGYQQSTEIFDPATGNWSSSGNLSVARYIFASTTLADGSILVCGGDSNNGMQSSAEIFKLVAQGGACSSVGECESGYCVDGVCCNSACNSLCQACSTAKKGSGANGVCGTIANGTDPDNECADQGAFSCGTTGVCNGSGACALYAANTVCGNPTCTSGSLNTYACNGGGACLSTQSQCAPYKCATGSACGTTCNTDNDCATTGWCRVSDHTCQQDQPNGSPCSAASQCSSGSCVDGVCCATACTGLCQACSNQKKGSGVDGECGPIKDGSDPDAECTDQGAPSCQNDGQCNGAGACRKYAKGTSCGATTCVGNSSTGQVCDGFGACVNDTTGTDCSPYLCKGSSCANPCVADSDCISGNFCEAGTCKPKQANGATCSGANACTSGYCVDGVCCNSACTGLCQACSSIKKGNGTNGDCGPIVTGKDPDNECASTATSTCGTDGWCNGAGACRLWSKGTTCGADVCVGNNKTGKSCDGFGTCGNNATGSDCAPYVCSGGLCQSPCTTDGNCTNGNFCNAGVCTPKQASGAACTGTNQCQSGYCVDGVCCITPCTGACQACSAAKKGGGVDGDCAPVVNGSDPDNDCPDDGATGCQRDGQCNGLGACRLYAKGSACGPLSCVGNKVSGKFCDGFGSCQFDPVGTECAPYVCATDKCANPCSSDNDCTAGNYCSNGTCKGKQVSGAPCTGTNQCQSGYCVDGVCCATSCTGLCQACTAVKKGGGVDGECGNIAVASDPDDECPDDGAATCKRNGDCNGFGACQLYKKGESCGQTQCVGNLVKGQICDGLGSCGFDSTGTDCAPYVCAGNACADPCSSNLDCLSGNFCDNGTCKGKLTNGSACTANADCQSTYCVDGVCCATACTGTCQACTAAKKGGGVDGECEPIKDGLDPDNDCPDDGAETCKRDGACNGSGLCRFYSKGTTCKPGTTTCVGNFAKGYLCDGLGTCEYEAIGTDCSPFVCANNQCANPCTADTDCVVGNFCDLGVCKGKLPNGSQCAAGTQCSSGFCVDGVCCDSACNGQCEACDVAPNQGTCAPAIGAPHGTRPACKGAGATCEGSCDGVNTSSCVYPGSSTACGSSCASGNETPSFCDSNGECKPASPKSCTPYVCGTDSCKTSCETKADCASGYTCASDKTCKPLGTTCTDDHTLTSPDGTSKDCSPFKCELDACKSSCESIDDCVLPAVCRASDKVCAVPSSSGSSGGDSGGGCGCAVPGEDSPPQSGAWLAAALAALAFGRRRRSASRRA